MDSDKLREDIVSPLLKVSTYKGFTLTGPKEAIVRKVYSSQSQTRGTGVWAQADANSSFTQLNFRLLGTSPSCMLNARIRLVVPLRFFAPASNMQLVTLKVQLHGTVLQLAPAEMGF